MGLSVIHTVVVGAYVAGIWGLPIAVEYSFRPLRRQHKGPPEPTRFVLIDLLVLMAWLQPCLAVMLLGGPEWEGDRKGWGMMAFLLSVLMIAAWQTWASAVSSFCDSPAV